MIPHQISKSVASATVDTMEAMGTMDTMHTSARDVRAQARAGGVSRRGQSLVEYVLIILFVALAVILALSLLAPTINSIFRSIPPAL